MRPSLLPFWGWSRWEFNVFLPFIDVAASWLYSITMSTQPLLQRTATKRIALPVRVEPKVSFANERTFLSWLHFTVVLGGLAVGLLNFGDRVGKISAAMFSAVGECSTDAPLFGPATGSR